MPLPLLLLAPVAIVQYCDVPPTFRNIAGDWELTVGEGEQSFEAGMKLTFDPNTNAVGGTLDTPFGEGTITEGTFVNNQLSLKGTINVILEEGKPETKPEAFSLQAAYENDSLKGTCSTGEGPAINCTAKRILFYNR